MPKKLYFKLDKQNRVILPAGICDRFNFDGNAYLSINDEQMVCIYDSYMKEMPIVQCSVEELKSNCIRIKIPKDLRTSTSFKAGGTFFILRMENHIKLYPCGKVRGS